MYVCTHQTRGDSYNTYVVIYKYNKVYNND